MNQLPAKTEDLVQMMLKGFPADRISAQDSLQHPYFSTLPAPIMHLRDSKNFCVKKNQMHANRATCYRQTELHAKRAIYYNVAC